MKLVLILMIKNEEKILKRCLDALTGVVDAFCICDTGSTDNTKEIALEFLKTHPGCFSEETFKDFGYNRTISFINARQYLIDFKWDLTDTYGLLLDADMVFVPGKLKQQNLTAVGYKTIQKNGTLEYYNARIIRMDYNWKCVGVTHEYWAGPADDNLEKDICFIDDKNDGGCKHDKFERDARLLEQGLLDEPKNERYMFYLAQTYKCLGRFKDSIDMYTKRIEAGGWAEEVWYSYYMIGECYKHLNNFSDFEKWMQLAFQYRPHRSESIYKLAEHFRTVGQHYKSYHYIKIGQIIPFPKDDVLFIETNVYEGLFDYEASIVDYYIHPERGLKSSMNTMMKTFQHSLNIISNLKFYVKPLNATIEKVVLPPVFGENFTTSAISVCDYPMANVRYINYWIDNGEYKTKDSVSVQTRNAYFNLETLECISQFKELPPRFVSNVCGLEDMRIHKVHDKLYFTAVSVREFIENEVSMVSGEYDTATSSYSNSIVMDSPINSTCEKNWLHVPGTDDFIYSWNPLRVGKMRENKIIFFKDISLPPFFSLLRGSAPPIEVNGKWFVLTHLVEYSKCRNYYHCIVQLEKESYIPRKVSMPFTFKGNGIEYCISGRLLDNNILEYYVSFMDKDSSRVRFNINSIEWINLN
jgi:glycosyltransferase involved in cell wall biosynthesis